jgi:hypothetical protein
MEDRGTAFHHGGHGDHGENLEKISEVGVTSVLVLVDKNFRFFAKNSCICGKTA